MNGSDQHNQGNVGKANPGFASETSPKTNMSPRPIPLRTWIIGLSAPLLLTLFCGGFFLLLIGANYYVNKGNINLWIPFINVPGSSAFQNVNSSGGSFSALPTDAALAKIQDFNNRIFELQQHAVEKYTDAQMDTIGNTLTYTISLDNSIPASFGVGWCARNQEILKNNLADMEIMLTVDGNDIDKNHVAPWAFFQTNGMICERFDVVLDNWSVGEHTLVANLKLKAPLNDGYSDYGAGVMGSIYKVTVKSAVEATPVPKK